MASFSMSWAEQLDRIDDARDRIARQCEHGRIINETDRERVAGLERDAVDEQVADAFQRAAVPDTRFS